MEGEGKALVHCDARVHQGDPARRRGSVADGGARGDSRVPKLSGKEEAETEILVGVVRGIDHRPVLVGDIGDQGRLTLAKDTSEQAKQFIDASLRGRNRPPSKAPYPRAIKLARQAIAGPGPA